jgi:hypothetical protein
MEVAGPEELGGKGLPRWVPALSLAIAAALGAWYLLGGAGGRGVAAAGFPLDDAWIHQVYARSVARGEPFQYNPGEPETGATSPLWALLLAPPHAVGVPPVAWTKALGILLTAAAAIAGGRLLARLGLPGAGTAFALTLPALPYVSFAAVSGTEVALFVWLLLLTFDAARARRWAATGALAGLAILARPEGYLLLPLLAAAAAIAARRRGVAAALADVLRLGLPALAVLSPWVGYCLWASGRPLPATFYAKAHWFGLANLAQWRKVGAWLAYQPASGGGLPVPLAALAAVLALGFAAAGALRLTRRDPLAWLPAAFPLVFLWGLTAELPMGIAARPAFPGSVLTFYFARYLLPALPFLHLLWLAGLPQADAPATRAARRGAAAAGLVAAVLAGAAGAGQQVTLRAVYAWNCRDIEEAPVAAARWIADHVPPGATVAVSDAGAIRFFGGHRVVDLVGLNCHRLLPLLAAIDATTEGGPEDVALRERFWREERPDFLAITEGWHRPLLLGHPMRVLATFRPTRNTIFGAEELVVLQPVPPPDEGVARGPAAPYPSSS